MSDDKSPVKVSSEVVDAIEAVRESGKTNMLDRHAVAELALVFGYDDASEWITKNRALYARGLFNGFEISDEG